MNNYRLSVCIITRDREILTMKTIESVIKSTRCFDECRIYVFDNLSNPSQSRLQLFSKLLSNDTIQYYSYDSEKSLNNCFGKAFIFQRFIKMMKMEHELREYTDKDSKLEDLYLLLDSDIIIGKNWPKYFIPAYQAMKELEPQLYFLVKFPGGVSVEAVKHPETHLHTLHSQNDQEFNIIASVHGGGSAFWLSDYNQLCKLEIPMKDILNTYNRFKGHDVGIWNYIKRKHNLSGIRYVGAVMSPDPEDPLVLHLGGVLNSSICNILNNQGSGAYRKIKHDFELKELSLKNMSIEDIYDKYKHDDFATLW